MAKQKVNRCAIYTRKSTEEGLEQEFNSLDAQRMAGENYIASQTGQGWVCLPGLYDDGGYTGGNMDRPALRRLLADIDEDRIDCVVVYKVDRLSRSLMDFAKILSQFEERSVSFVSVTQQFNTTTSMGRLTLNILLSFAQFEREVISERTRDKIAMARKRGQYTGGAPVLGYDLAPQGSKIIINEAEAQQVRNIFRLYLEKQSMIELVEVLDQKGWCNKSWVTRKGTLRVGRAFNKKTLRSLLSNPIYVGKTRYKDEIYEGEHEGIVDLELFQNVQRCLIRNAHSRSTRGRGKNGGILNGILSCKSCGCGMSHSYSKKGDKRYRYYVCLNAQKRGWSNCPHPSLPADEIEKFVVDEIRTICQDKELLQEVVGKTHAIRENEINLLRKKHKQLQAELLDLQKQEHAATIKPESLPEASQMAVLEDQIMLARQRLGEAALQIKLMQKSSIDADEIREACRSFDPIWDVLTNNQQWRILHLLIEQVSFDASDSSIAITFHPAGIKILNESEQKGAVAS